MKETVPEPCPCRLSHSEELQRLVVGHVATLLEVLEESPGERMDDLLPAPVLGEILLRDVGGVSGAMDHDVVPGLLAVGLGEVALVPGVIRLADGIAAEDRPTITIPLVQDKLAELEPEAIDRLQWMIWHGVLSRSVSLGAGGGLAIANADVASGRDGSLAQGPGPGRLACVAGKSIAQPRCDNFKSLCGNILRLQRVNSPDQPRTRRIVSRATGFFQSCTAGSRSPTPWIPACTCTKPSASSGARTPALPHGGPGM